MSCRLLFAIAVGLFTTPSLSSQVTMNDIPGRGHGFALNASPGRDNTIAAAAPTTKAPKTRAVELKGAIRIGGQAASSVRLTFQHSHGVQRQWRARVKSDGTYKVKLVGGDTDVICARIERRRPLNWFSRCSRYSAGVHQLDFDLPPGIIRVEIPPSHGRMPQLASVRVEGARGGAGRSFKPAKGFRGDYFAADLGIYVITVIEPEHEELLASWPVTLTADQPEIGIKLAISRKSIPRSPAVQHR